MIQSQPLKDIEGYKEEYIQALCKQVVIYSLANDQAKSKNSKTYCVGLTVMSLPRTRWLNVG